MLRYVFHRMGIMSLCLAPQATLGMTIGVDFTQFPAEATSLSAQAPPPSEIEVTSHV